MKVLYPLTTEKAMGSIEENNSLVFAVEKTATKGEVRLEVEKLYGEKVASVNTNTTARTGKKAVVKFAKPGAAADIASKLKVV
ncbi:MAG: 50S ribosomal protein L23 [Candidatus Micrarchaeia archaeon]|jgi:ribosomal protein L23